MLDLQDARACRHRWRWGDGQRYFAEAQVGRRRVRREGEGPPANLRVERSGLLDADHGRAARALQVRPRREGDWRRAAQRVRFVGDRVRACCLSLSESAWIRVKRRYSSRISIRRVRLAVVCAYDML